MPAMIGGAIVGTAGSTGSEDSHCMWAGGAPAPGVNPTGGGGGAQPSAPTNPGGPSSIGSPRGIGSDDRRSRANFGGARSSTGGGGIGAARLYPEGRGDICGLELSADDG